MQLAIEKNKTNHWFVVMTVCIGAFMAALDASIMNIAMPRMQHDFHITMEQIEWVSLVYLLTLASTIVLFGRLADMKGRSMMYTLGFVVFALSSLGCGLALSFPILLFSRICQAVGAALLQANSVSIITAVTPEHSRGKAIGIQASAQGIGLTFGPPIGGALLTYFNWRWLFLVNVPVGVIGITLALMFLPKDHKGVRKERFDLLGAMYLAFTLILFTYILNQFHQFNLHSIKIWGLFLVLIAGIAFFLLREKRARYPIVDLSLFKIREFSLGNITGVLSFTVMYAVLFLTPYMMEQIFHWSTLRSGSMLTFIPLGMTLITPVAGTIADISGIRLPSIAGMAASAAGCLLIVFTDHGSGFYTGILILGLFLVGLGLGLFTPPNNSGVMGCVPRERLGVTGGFLNMSRTVGMNFGIAMGGLTYNMLQKFIPAGTASGMSAAFHDSYLIFAGIAVVTVTLSYLNKHIKRDPDYFFGEGI